MTDTPQLQQKMTAAEFRQLPETTERIELIDGEIFMSPSPRNPHQKVTFRIASFLDGLDKGEVIISPMDVYLSDEVAVQPDVFWVSGPDSPCQLGDDGYWHGPPDLVVEVLSPSTAARDRGVKARHYEQFGVREYWLVDPDAQFIEMFTPQDGRFVQVGLYEVDKTFKSPLLSVEVTVKSLF
jgi:Uma2 family endonuclease